jgi:hypothetical protein
MVHLEATSAAQLFIGVLMAFMMNIDSYHIQCECLDVESAIYSIMENHSLCLMHILGLRMIILPMDIGIYGYRTRMGTIRVHIFISMGYTRTISVKSWEKHGHSFIPAGILIPR